jgi:DNA-directed RNA polymerase subunit beta'
LRPRIELLQEGTRAGRIFLPDLAALAVVQGQQVERGSLIASLPRERARAADVPPRRILVEAALQGRAPGPVGLMAEQDGFVSLELLDGWTYRLTITPDGEGEGVCYELPFDAVLRFQHGDFVRAGELISEGSVDPWEVLRIQGEAALVRHVCDTVAECYAYERPEGHVDERAYELAVRAGYLGRSRGVR